IQSQHLHDLWRAAGCLKRIAIGTQVDALPVRPWLVGVGGRIREFTGIDRRRSGPQVEIVGRAGRIYELRIAGERVPFQAQLVDQVHLAVEFDVAPAYQVPGPARMKQVIIAIELLLAISIDGKRVDGYSI